MSEGGVLGQAVMWRQRLLIREANYLRKLVGLPPVKADERKGAGRDDSQVSRRGLKIPDFDSLTEISARLEEDSGIRADRLENEPKAERLLGT